VVPSTVAMTSGNIGLIMDIAEPAITSNNSEIQENEVLITTKNDIIFKQFRIL
jgi:hypothetical protein